MCYVGSAVGSTVGDLVGICGCLAVGDLVGEVLGTISLQHIAVDERVVGNEAGLTFLLI